MVMAHNSSKKTTPKNVNDFPPGMAPKMLQMLQTVEQLEETLNPVIAKSHHEMFAKSHTLVISVRIHLKPG
ncbi:unnamed protein product [Rotaria socialis]|uniref:Uncharacterized protein n=1 Tax=Rotaria socialis TaxID=392032 RepID=A0A821V0G0_9BILA|nr:unnamed protein product [Rotaria socialis]CAF4898861.1 unnamed protein product [Rotaria socialis]